MAKEKQVAKNNQNLQKSDKGAELTHDKPVYLPPVDIFEDKNSIIIYADIPGVNDKNIDITLDDDVLTLTGQQNDQGVNKHELRYYEYRPGIYRRAFTLGTAIDRDKIDAKIKDGVLTLTLPKAETAKPRKITVDVG